MQPDPHDPDRRLDEGPDGPRRTDETTEADAGMVGGAATPPGEATETPQDTDPGAQDQDDAGR